MDHVTYCRDLFEYISKYRKFVLLFRNDGDSIND